MPLLPTPESLGQAPTPQASSAVASYQPGEVAAATQNLGQHALQAAQDFAQIRQSEIETQVNDAYVNQYAPYAAEQYQKFHALQGRDAVMPDKDGVTPMQKYIQSLQQKRQEMRDEIPGSYGKQIFDQRAGRHVEGELDSAANYADAQQKAYTAVTSKALQESYVDQATSKFLPQDEPGMRLSLQSGLAEIENFGQKTGQSPDVVHQLQSNYTSRVLTNVLYQQANTDPYGAMQRFKGTKDHPGLSAEIDDAQLKPQILAHLTERANNAEQSQFAFNQMHGMPMTASGKTFAPAPPGASIPQMGDIAVKNAIAYADLTHPNDPHFKDALVSRIKSDTSGLLWQKNLTDADALGNVVAGMTAPDGTRRTFSDAMSDPVWSAKYNALPLKLQGQVRSSFIGAENVLTPESARALDAIKGLAITDPDKFMAVDVGALVGHVPQAQVLEITGMKVALGKREQTQEQKAMHMNSILNDPSVVTTLVSSGLPVAQIKSKSANYNAFVGKFVPEVEAFEAAHKRPPNSGELAKITSGLTASVVTDPGMIWDTHKKVYKLEPTDVVYPKTNNDIAALPPGTVYMANGTKYVKK